MEDALEHIQTGMIEKRVALVELTYLATQWQPHEDPLPYTFWMASSEVDQKFLGYFAKSTSIENNYLSSFLFRVLGLSVILAEKLLRARKSKRLDPIRDPKAKHLVHHILWLAKEGLVMVEQYILPMADNYVELKVLSYKLKASFYHIFVLFHNNPPVNDRINRSRSDSFSLYPDPLSPKLGKPSSRERNSQSPPGRRRSPAISLGGPIGGNAVARTPPGLPIPASYNRASNTDTNVNNGTATFILALKDYIPDATAAFREASSLADQLLPGSHPIRLSVKVEFVAYVYDCLHEAEQSRRMARLTIRHVYEAQELMDDESYEDAAEMVNILGRMMKRGLGAGSSGGGSGPSKEQVSIQQQQQEQSPQQRQQRQQSYSNNQLGNPGGVTSPSQSQYSTNPPTTWV